MTTLPISELENIPKILGHLLSPYTTKSQFSKLVETQLSNKEKLSQVIKLANKNMLAPSLYHQLKKYGKLDQLDTTLQEYLFTISTFIKERNQKLRKQTEEIIYTLNAKNITPVLLKGANTLFSEVYPNSTRYMIDLDLLIPNNQAKSAQTILKEIDYYTPSFITNTLENHHHLPPIFKDGEEATVELHHKALKNIYSQILDNKYALSSVFMIPNLKTRNLKALSLSAENQILHCFVHSELSSSNYKALTLDMRQLEYFVLLIRHYGEENINWKELMKNITTNKIKKPFFLYLYKAKVLFNLKIPSDLSIYNGEIDQQRQKFQQSLRSSHDSGYTLWRLYHSLMDTYDRTFSKSALANNYGKKAVLNNLYKYRIMQFIHLSKQYNNPALILKKVKLSFSKYHS